MIATICLYALVSVSESVLVKFSALYLVSKVSEKSGIGPALIVTTLQRLQTPCTNYHSLVKTLQGCSKVATT